MNETSQIRSRLSAHITGGEAFMTLDELLKEFPFDKLGNRPYDLPYSFYELFYHIRFTQKDILDYCTSKEYKEQSWPKDYWPEVKAPWDEMVWNKLKEEYFRERELFIEHLQDPETDLLAIVKKGTSHTFLREVLLVIEHTAYHTGQLQIIRRLLKIQ